MEIITKEYYPGGQEQTKTFDKIKAYASKRSGLSIYFRVISETSISKWEYLGRMKEEVNEFIFPYGKNRGNGIQFRIIESGQGIPPIFKGISLLYATEGVEE